MCLPGLAVIGLLLLLCSLWSITLGAADIDRETVFAALLEFDSSAFEHLIIRTVRFPRVLGGILVGLALAVSGAILQALTLNPLADSGILGINAGAAFAVVVTVFLLRESSLAAYAIALLKEALGDSLSGKTVSMVRAVLPEQLRLRLAGSSGGILQSGLGIERPESQQPVYDQTTGFIQTNISQESWQHTDGHYLFVHGAQPTADGSTEAQALIDSLAVNAIWNKLEAVNGHCHGLGVFAAHDIIDNILTILAETRPTIASPFVAPDAEAESEEATSD